MILRRPAFEQSEVYAPSNVLTPDMKISMDGRMENATEFRHFQFGSA